jgi:hypothetical protein
MRLRIEIASKNCTALIHCCHSCGCRVYWQKYISLYLLVFFVRSMIGNRKLGSYVLYTLTHVYGPMFDFIYIRMCMSRCSIRCLSGQRRLKMLQMKESQFTL